VPGPVRRKRRFAVLNMLTSTFLIRLVDIGWWWRWWVLGDMRSC
jgi:hypothetical protein